MSEVLHPWHSIQASQEGSCVNVSFWGRRIVQEGTLFPSSIQTQAQELLYAPIRLVGRANDETIVWHDQGCYLLSPQKEKAVVNGYAESQCLIANSTLAWEYDGAARWDVKVMPRGNTVPQLFGLEPPQVIRWDLQMLHLEIPLRKEAVQLYVSWPKGGVCAINGGDELSENGCIPEGGMTMPFKPALWLGNEKLGLQLVAESDENWQPEETDKAIVIEDAGDHWVLKLRLLDSLPRTWSSPSISSPQVNFSFGLLATPVKPIDPAFHKIKAVHIDCFTKIVGDYWPFLNGPVSDENPEKVIDRLSRAGVNLLILHEKWNKIQNYWETAVQTKEEITRLVQLCHSRGIRVIPYFGYEITSAMPSFAQVRDEVSVVPETLGGYASMWYRVPYQRANMVCYRSEWKDRLVEGMLGCIDQFDFDGVYLDGTACPWGCVNEKHGCGYTGSDGKRHATYPLFDVRDIMRKIYTGVHKRGGIVNPHLSGVALPFITAFSDMIWDGEHIQTDIWRKGIRNFSLEYFRAEYLGVNHGIPMQFIVYEVPGAWNFDMALSICLIHGVYPRPNSIHHPLDVMEELWKVLELYGIADAQFEGYWENAQAWSSSHEQIKLSFYRREQLDGSLKLLVFAANPTVDACLNTRLSICPAYFGKQQVRSIFDVRAKAYLDVAGNEWTADMPNQTYQIYEMVLA